MKMYKSIILNLLFTSVYSNIPLYYLRKNYVDFYTSIGHGFSKQEFFNHLSKKSINDKAFLSLLRIIYNKNNFLKIKVTDRSKIPKIPKIIHQIWLGSPFPKRYKKWQRSWQRLHPGWRYKLWTDKDVQKFNFKNRELYNKATNWGQKSDILRYEILYQYGGLYVDTDFECLRSFEALVYYYDFIAAINPIKLGTILNNCIIASCPGHPILKRCIQNLNDQLTKKFNKGCKLQKKKNQGYFWTDKHSAIIQDTGPGFFSRCVKTYLVKNMNMQLNNLFLPSSYVFPLVDFTTTNLHYKRSESFAKHYWDGSWWKSDQ